jgi:hypothetical protein
MNASDQYLPRKTMRVLWPALRCFHGHSTLVLAQMQNEVANRRAATGSSLLAQDASRSECATARRPAPMIAAEDLCAYLDRREAEAWDRELQHRIEWIEFERKSAMPEAVFIHFYNDVPWDPSMKLTRLFGQRHDPVANSNEHHRVVRFDWDRWDAAGASLRAEYEAAAEEEGNAPVADGLRNLAIFTEPDPVKRNALRYAEHQRQKHHRTKAQKLRTLREKAARPSLDQLLANAFPPAPKPKFKRRF